MRVTRHTHGKSFRRKDLISDASFSICFSKFCGELTLTLRGAERDTEETSEPRYSYSLELTEAEAIRLLRDLLDHATGEGDTLKLDVYSQSMRKLEGKYR